MSWHTVSPQEMPGHSLPRATCHAGGIQVEVVGAEWGAVADGDLCGGPGEALPSAGLLRVPCRPLGKAASPVLHVRSLGRGMWWEAGQECVWGEMQVTQSAERPGGLGNLLCAPHPGLVMFQPCLVWQVVAASGESACQVLAVQHSPCQPCPDPGETWQFS